MLYNFAIRYHGEILAKEQNRYDSSEIALREGSRWFKAMFGVLQSTLGRKIKEQDFDLRVSTVEEQLSLFD